MNYGVFGYRLRKARESKGYTVIEFAKVIGVDDHTISKYEHGKKPSLDTLINIAETLNLSIDWLLGRK